MRSLCDKMGYSPMKQYELLEVTLENRESMISPDESVPYLARRVKESGSRLVVRKKPNEVSASVGTPVFKRILNPSKTAGISSQEVSSISLDSQPTSSSSTDVHQSAPSLVEAVSDMTISMPCTLSESWLDQSDSLGSDKAARKRRLSIPSIANFIFGGLARSRKNTSSVKLESEDYPIFKTRSDERKLMLNTMIPDSLMRLFENTENHGLNFGKLSSRKRFLSWTRSSNASSNSSIHQSTVFFGVKLEDLMQRELENDGSKKIPQFFLDCSVYLEENCLHVPGIFRVSGVQKRVKFLKSHVDQGEEIDFSKIVPHDVTSLMKMFLREMPEPLLSFRLYEFYIASAKHLKDSALDEAIKLLTLTLPIAHLTVLRQLLHLLRKIAEHSETAAPAEPLKSDEQAAEPNEAASDDSGSDITGNLMSMHNLAIVIAPNILRSKERINSDLLVAHAAYSHIVVEHMIQMGDHLFNVPKETMNAARIATS